jgi:3',5'-cyclic AMP phosphodiesterase CpdA
MFIVSSAETVGLAMFCGDSMHELRILHISDLHEKGPREKETWRKRRVLGSPWDANIAEFLRDGPIDLVCFTGDAANWGLPEGYAAATDFFRSLCHQLRISTERLFVVPGNHDVSRKINPYAWRRIRSSVARGADMLALSRWMAGVGSAPIGIKDAWRAQVIERQAGYREWVKTDLARPDLAVPFWYRSTLAIPPLPFSVNVIGLNSAWACGDDNDARKLILTENQVMNGVTERGSPLSGFRLLLMHHPFEDSIDGSDCRRLISGHVDLVLRGHLHEPTVSSWATDGVRQFAAGSLYDGDRADHYHNSCQLITLQLDSSGSLKNIIPRIRSWSPKGHWYDDNSIVGGSHGGRVEEEATSFLTPSKEPAAANPYDPWLTRIDNFVDRTDVLQRLETAVHRNHSVLILGDWRIGKSLLLHVWHRRLEALGREGVLLSGQRPEGTSAASFVHAITGRTCSDVPDLAANELAEWASSKSPPPVILLDETGSAIHPLGARFMERLRGMLGSLVLVLAAREHTVFSELGRGSPWHNTLEVIWLAGLEKTAAEQLIRLGAAPHADLIRRWVGRHPYFIQLFGYFLVEGERSGHSPARALDLLREQAALPLKDIWRVLTPKEQQDLYAVAHGTKISNRTLRSRGLLTEDNEPFGELLTAFIKEEL